MCTTYPILNLVYPCIYILKQIFAPKIEENETVDSYLDLIYSPLTKDDILESTEDDDSSSTSDDNDIPTAENKDRDRGQDQNRKHTTKKNENVDVSQIECLLSACTQNLIKKVRAAIYLSLKKLWEIPLEIFLIAMILDSRMKNFSFADINGENIEVNTSVADNNQTQVQDKVTHYLCYPDESRNIDLLIWWQEHQ
ncbi:21917_t:CDS:2, partial [Cetraspora pellucida]